MLPLGARQRRFVDEYAIDHNGAAAAMRAGYSPRSARITASRLLTKANVRAAISERQTELADELRLSKDGVIRRLVDAIAVARRNDDPRAMIAGWSAIARLCGFYDRAG